MGRDGGGCLVPVGSAPQPPPVTRDGIERGRHVPGDLGRFLGLGTRQGRRDYLDGEDALLTEYRRIGEQARRPATGDGATDPFSRLAGRTRATCGADLHTARHTRRQARARTARRDWIAGHRLVVEETVLGLLLQCSRVGLHPDPTDEHDE